MFSRVEDTILHYTSLVSQTVSHQSLKRFIKRSIDHQNTLKVHPLTFALLKKQAEFFNYIDQNFPLKLC